ncbi:MAG: hypothetical protein IH600_02115 [Bacteroidetes bacterium]|nr:hypothetical protein [Bacteroidota bacterium]
MPSFLLSFIQPVLGLIQSVATDSYSETLNKIFLLSVFTVIFPLSLGTLGFKKLDKAFRYFTVLLLLVLISEASAYALARQYKPNLYIYDIFSAIEYVFLILVFSRWFPNRGIRWILYSSIPIFLIIWSSGKYFSAEVDKFDSIFLSIESVVFVILSVLTLVKEMRDSSVLLVDNPVFWIASGLLVYFAGNLFVFSLIEQLFRPGVDTYHGIWIIHTALNVTKNILFSFGILSTGAPKYGWKVITRRPRSWWSLIWRKLRKSKEIEQN